MHLKLLGKSGRHEPCVAALCDIPQAGRVRHFANLFGLQQRRAYVGAGRAGRRNGAVGSCVAVGYPASARRTTGRLSKAIAPMRIALTIMNATPK